VSEIEAGGSGRLLSFYKGRQESARHVESKEEGADPALREVKLSTTHIRGAQVEQEVLYTRRSAAEKRRTRRKERKKKSTHCSFQERGGRIRRVSIAIARKNPGKKERKSHDKSDSCNSMTKMKRKSQAEKSRRELGKDKGYRKF